jgi:predicted DNA-binding transcriptional regulator AlpA
MENSIENSPTVADEEPWDIDAVARYFGGTRPLNRSTIYRGIKLGIYPAPFHPSPNVARWLPSWCRAARQRLIDAAVAE